MSKKTLFALILILAFILRFYKLGDIPLSLDWDENSNAYNAYSILKTGRDEYGTFLPITNRSFDDFKPPLYMYLNVPTVAIFNLTPFAARLPSAIFGFLTVPVVYYLARKLFIGFSPKKREAASLLSAFFLAISPWHIQFSRVGFESNVGLFFAAGSLTAFLYGFNNKKWLITSSILLGLSAYSYHAERIFVPLLFLGTFALFFKQITQISRKYLASFFIITTLIGLPLIILIPPSVILQRFEATTGRPNLEDIERSIKFIIQDQDQDLKFGNYVHNRRFVIGQTYLGNYLSHFSPNFLFTKGDDNFRHHIQEMGMIYLFEFPLILFGLFHLIKNKSKESKLILLWLIIAPIAATPATPNPHANRALPMDVPLQIISAYALVIIISSTKGIFQKSIFFASSIIIATSAFLYLHNYYAHYTTEKASFWQYGYKEAVIESEKLKGKYSKINIDSSLEQAYAFWLFNTKFDPESYQKSGSSRDFDVYHFDAKKPTNSSELFIYMAKKHDGLNVLKTIYYPDGTEAIKIGTPK